MTNAQIEEIVVQAIRQVNLGRTETAQLEASADAPLFGPGSALDSLGLVSLLIDIEEALQDRGHDVSLSDDRAMSQTASPFRSVPALVAYISEHLGRAS